MDQCAIGKNDIDANDALARHPASPAVPTKAALQQEATHTDGVGMCHREEKFVLHKGSIKFTGEAAWADHCRALRRVDRNAVKP